MWATSRRELVLATLIIHNNSFSRVEEREEKIRRVGYIYGEQDEKKKQGIDRLNYRCL